MAQKLTLDQVVKIRELYERGFTQRSLAKKFGVTTSNVASVVRYETFLTPEARRELARVAAEKIQPEKPPVGIYLELPDALFEAIKFLSSKTGRSIESLAVLHLEYAFGLRSKSKKPVVGPTR